MNVQYIYYIIHAYAPEKSTFKRIKLFYNLFSSLIFKDGKMCICGTFYVGLFATTPRSIK